MESTIKELNLHRTWTKVPGYSFTAKMWGEFSVAKLRQIVFSDKAFEYLVLEKEKKLLIQSLITNSKKGFTDVIEGKGGGVVFLLHGPPGVGKTLTAEAVSELLHRPLYSINIGELGVTTAELEKSLKKILELACDWNAIVLLDEADIFLEKRSLNDVQRNALVGIFLRLLEYNQSVLFLTSNRVRSFDEAFHSRISLALYYKPLDQPGRKQIWDSLLQASDYSKDILDTTALSQRSINGRQIKTSIKLAQSLAAEESRSMTIQDLECCISLMDQFHIDFEASRD